MSGILKITETLFSTAPVAGLGRGKEIFYLQKDGKGVTLVRGAKVEHNETYETRLHQVSQKVATYLDLFREKNPPEDELKKKVTFFLHADQLEQCSIRRNDRIDKSVWLTILDVIVRVLTLFLVSLKENLKNPLIDLPGKVDAIFGKTEWKELLAEFKARGQFPKSLERYFENRFLSEKRELMTGNIKENRDKVFQSFLTTGDEFAIDQLNFESIPLLALVPKKRKIGEPLSLYIDQLTKGKNEKFLFSLGKPEANIAFCKRDTIWEVLWHNKDSLFLRQYVAMPQAGGEDLFLTTKVERILDEIAGGKGAAWVLQTPTTTS